MVGTVRRLRVVMAANGRLMVLSDAGMLMIAPASAKKFTPSAKAKVLDGKCWTVPVLANGACIAAVRPAIWCVWICDQIEWSPLSRKAGRGGERIKESHEPPPVHCRRPADSRGGPVCSWPVRQDLSYCLDRRRLVGDEHSPRSNGWWAIFGRGPVRRRRPDVDDRRRAGE